MNLDIPEKENIIKSNILSGDVNNALIILIKAVFETFRDYPNGLFYYKFDRLLEKLGALFPCVITKLIVPEALIGR